MTLTTTDIETALKAHEPLAPLTHLSIQDESGGCGSAFAIELTSTAFDGLRLVERHRLVHSALEAHMEKIHALQLKCYTPAAYARQQAK